VINPSDLHKKIESVTIFGGDDEERSYLGASVIGEPCSRKLWLMFNRYVEPEKFDARMFRLFFRGKREEPVIESLLIECGFEVIDSCLEQAGFREGFFGGSGDGVYMLNGKRVAVEMKTCSDKSFSTLKPGNLREIKPLHYAQCQIYQKKFDCDYALYIAINKNDDRIFVDTVEFNLEHYNEYLNKATYITTTDKPPERIASKASDFRCKFCHAHAVCWGIQIPRVHCRNCATSDKEPINGKFICEMNDNKELDSSGSCAHHAWNPHAMQDLQGWSALEFYPDKRAVKYQRPDGTEFTNGFDFIQSKDLTL